MFVRVDGSIHRSRIAQPLTFDLTLKSLSISHWFVLIHWFQNGLMLVPCHTILSGWCGLSRGILCGCAAAFLRRSAPRHFLCKAPSRVKFNKYGCCIFTFLRFSFLLGYVGGFCLWINMWKEKEAFHAEYMLAVLTLANALSFLAFALSCYSWIGRVSASNTLRSHRPFTRNVRIATLFAFFVGGPTIIFGIVLGSKSSEYELFNFISIAGSILPVIIIAPLCLYLVLRLRANQALAHPSTERLRAISQKSRILPIPCLLALVIAIARLAVFGCLSMEEPVAFLCTVVPCFSTVSLFRGSNSYSLVSNDPFSHYFRDHRNLLQRR